MPTRPTTSSRSAATAATGAAAEPTPRQRWQAAQRLAAGDPPVLAAAMAGLRLASLTRLEAEDAEFQELLAACRAVAALPLEAWRERLIALTREAAERAVAEGRLGTINLCLRSLAVLADPPRAAPEEEDPLEAFFAGLTPEQWAEYEALGGQPSRGGGGEEEEEEEDGGDGDEDGDGERDGAGFSAPVLPFRRHPHRRCREEPAATAAAASGQAGRSDVIPWPQAAAEGSGDDGEHGRRRGRQQQLGAPPDRGGDDRARHGGGTARAQPDRAPGGGPGEAALGLEPPR